MRPEAKHLFRQEPGWDWEAVVTGTWDRVVVYDGETARKAKLMRGTSEPWLIAYYSLEAGQKPPPEPTDVIGASGQKQARTVAKSIAARESTMSDHGGCHTFLPTQHQDMPIVLHDPERLAESLTHQITKKVTTKIIASRLSDLINAKKTIVTESGAIEVDDWPAVAKGLQLAIEHTAGKPLQRTQINLKQNADPEADVMERLKNPHMARAMMAAVKEANPELFRQMMEEMQ